MSEIENADILIVGSGMGGATLAAGLAPSGARILILERGEQLRDTLPIGRVVGPADVAALAVHIMSNTALTGATYDIDGGQQLVVVRSR